MKSDRRGCQNKTFPSSWQVPSLNDVPLHYLKPNSLVKFRCLIQDMFDPEFYMAAYETVDPNTKAKVGHAAVQRPVQCVLPDVTSHLLVRSVCSQVLRNGKYKDVTECGVGSSQCSFRRFCKLLASVHVHSQAGLFGSQVDLDLRSTMTAERQTFYCVPIPGENSWVKEISLPFLLLLLLLFNLHTVLLCLKTI